jgi:hypothetical protein
MMYSHAQDKGTELPQDSILPEITMLEYIQKAQEIHFDPEVPCDNFEQEHGYTITVI